MMRRAAAAVAVAISIAIAGRVSRRRRIGIDYECALDVDLDTAGLDDGTVNLLGGRRRIPVQLSHGSLVLHGVGRSCRRRHHGAAVHGREREKRRQRRIGTGRGRG